MTKQSRRPRYTDRDDVENVAALGAYIRALREAIEPKLSRSAVARAIGVSEDTVVMVENGKRASSYAVVAAMLDVVGGNEEEASRIVLDMSITPDQARAIALARVQQRPEERSAGVIPADLVELAKATEGLDEEARERLIAAFYAMLRAARAARDE
jgi:DNA-binding XRE family transcriptional regulator